MLTQGRLRSALQPDNTDEFVQRLLAALEDSRVVDGFRLIMQPSISESLDSVTGVVSSGKGTGNTNQYTQGYNTRDTSS